MERLKTFKVVDRDGDLHTVDADSMRITDCGCLVFDGFNGELIQAFGAGAWTVAQVVPDESETN